MIHSIKLHIKTSVLAVFSFMLSVISTHAQIYVSQPLTGTPAPGSYYSNNSIILGSGFSFTASAGQSLQLYIQPDCVPLAANLTASQNYILISTPRVSGDTTANSLAGQTTCQLMQAVQYFDGLGRPLQTVNVKGSPLGNDIVQPYAYDQFGREAQKYLPYTAASGDGSFKTDALTAGAGLLNFYNPGGNGTSGAQQSNGIVVNPAPYAVVNFEPSPLNRVTEQGAPGTPWQPVAGSTAGHTVKLIYGSNDAPNLTTGTGRWARLYTVTIDPSTGARALVDSGSTGYKANQLYVTISQNENWTSGGQPDARLNTTEEYKDKEGHLVLKRTYNYTTSLQTLSTYYVYDDLGNLAFVLPPQANPDNGLSSTANQTTLNNLCYQYSYDQRNRLVSKQLPGKGVEEMVYNLLDQAIYSRDAAQAGRQEWAFTKYDALGRVIMTGIEKANNSTRAALQGSVTSALMGTTPEWETPSPGSGLQGYTNNCLPNSSNVVSLVVNYYDDYTFQGRPATFTTPAGASTMTKGLLTATKTAVLNTIYNATPDMLWSVHYYDDLARVTQTYAQHYLGGTVNAGNYDLVTNTYDFTNEITTTTRQHFNTTNPTSPVVTIANTYNYDHTGRKTKAFEQINGGANVLLSQIDYNETGQVMTKHLHSVAGSSFMQNIGYTYNERGWLANSSAPLFTMQLGYNTGSAPQFNGNIASQVWTTQLNPAGSTYNYAYDYLNRLASGTSSDNYNETGISYDLAGNIQTLQRTWGTTTAIDNLAYTYTNTAGNYTNQVQSISDAASDNSGKGYKAGTFNYHYDVNGNMSQDNSKGLTIAYNILNLPQSIILPGGTDTYVYDAAGQKLRKTSTLGTGSTTDYISGIEYDNGVINFIQTEEGRALYNNGNPNYEYSLADHLGNSRLTFDTHAAAPTIVQQDDYMPFGYEISRGAITNPKNEYLYNKKELQESSQLYDYGARFYDPVIARWNALDPMSEKYHRWSPYNYGADNPISNVDIHGDSLKTTGSQSATNTMKQVAEAGMGHNATMTQDKNGQWTLSSLTDDQALNMTPEQSKVYKTLNTIISDPKTASFNLVDEKDAISSSIYVGDNGTATGITATPGIHTVDMGDIKQFGTTGALTSQGALGHELSEGFQIQTKGTTPNDALFNTAIPTENAINGSTSHGAKLNTVGGTTTVSVPVTVGGTTKTVTITFKNGNIPPFGLQNNNR